jgi:hypothetical protein
MSAPSQARNFIVTLLFTVFGGPGILGVYLPAAITRWRIPASPMPLRVLAWLLIVIGLVPLAESIARFMWVGRGTLVPFAPTETLVIPASIAMCAIPCTSEYWPESLAK